MLVLASPAYRRLWAARTVSQCGDVAQFTALALLVFHLTGSGLGVSGVVVAEIVPVLLLAPLAGPLADRLPRVTVMIGADLARAVLATVLAIWHGEVLLVYAVAFGLSAGAVFSARPLVRCCPRWSPRTSWSLPTARSGRPRCSARCLSPRWLGC